MAFRCHRPAFFIMSSVNLCLSVMPPDPKLTDPLQPCQITNHCANDNLQPSIFHLHSSWMLCVFIYPPLSAYPWGTSEWLLGNERSWRERKGQRVETDKEETDFSSITHVLHRLDTASQELARLPGIDRRRQSKSKWIGDMEEDGYQNWAEELRSNYYLGSSYGWCVLTFSSPNGNIKAFPTWGYPIHFTKPRRLQCWSHDLTFSLLWHLSLLPPWPPVTPASDFSPVFLGYS